MAVVSTLFINKSKRAIAQQVEMADAHPDRFFSPSSPR
jgi:hypothetical protein